MQPYSGRTTKKKVLAVEGRSYTMKTKSTRKTTPMCLIDFSFSLASACSIEAARVWRARTDGPCARLTRAAPSPSWIELLHSCRSQVWLPLGALRLEIRDMELLYNYCEDQSADQLNSRLHFSFLQDACEVCKCTRDQREILQADGGSGYMVLLHTHSSRRSYC